ncbi:hypothetical protein F3Y22_tig00111402pilonHSYRG01492 [Hibiscus syriacus]|uniref:Uncharacterized protein n=1 Tax=Hibiscus syriacus TaxID=106335 RepID=A0A6A2YKV5_HIBSY|nr:hypothetical protein F3Y22_tig00111402pilonHSYRG01492 [Hibiscus syriacus]
MRSLKKKTLVRSNRFGLKTDISGSYVKGDDKGKTQAKSQVVENHLMIKTKRILH